MSGTFQQRATVPVIKCREVVGRLRKHGIHPSRVTGWDHSWGEPDAFLTTEDGRAWLVKIWTGDTLQPRLFDDSGGPPPLENLCGACGDWQKAQVTRIDGATKPAWVILAPSLDESIASPAESLSGFTVLNRRQCAKPERLAEAILDTAPLGDLSPEDQERWRAAAIPEVEIEPPAHVRRRIERTPEEPVAPLLLDYNQERCARLDLEPPAELDQMSADLKVRVVTGVAGCGKTLVLLHRAALLARHFPRARVLVVSHNRPLIADLDRRLRRREGGRGSIECRTFFQWLRRAAPPRGDLLPPYETRRWLETRLRSGAFPGLEKKSPEWVADEIAWMFDHALADETYLTAERRGRGTGLREPQRREILTLACAYRAYLAETGVSDWSEWPLSVWENCDRLKRAPSFDHLLIDEAQFFSPVWLNLLRACSRTAGHLFLCADRTQGFLRRRMSWAQVGLNVRSRSHRLERPYRSTREILAFARDFYRRRLPEDDEPLNLPSPEWLEGMASGRRPILLPGGSGEDQLRRLTAELAAFRNDGGEFADVLVLVAGRSIKVGDLTGRLRRHFGDDAVAEVKDEQAPDGAMGVGHLMAATGLERPVVFLLGVDELIAEEGNPALDKEERAGRIRDHTRQIYVGLTRAMERLAVFAGERARVEWFGENGEDRD